MDYKLIYCKENHVTMFNATMLVESLNNSDSSDPLITHCPICNDKIEVSRKEILEIMNEIRKKI